jgi:hypothetical protein
MQQAIDYEIRWQIEQIEDGHAIQQATVLFDPDTGETRAMRTKEDAADYRYFPDPDLPPLCISERVGGRSVRRDGRAAPHHGARFVADYGLPEYDATTLTQSKAMAAYFEATAKACGQPKLASNWIMGELSRRLNALASASLVRAAASCCARASSRACSSAVGWGRTMRLVTPEEDSSRWSRSRHSGMGRSDVIRLPLASTHTKMPGLVSRDWANAGALNTASCTAHPAISNACPARLAQACARRLRRRGDSFKYVYKSSPCVSDRPARLAVCGRGCLGQAFDVSTP